MKYGDILKSLRTQYNMSQQDVSDKLNINRSTYARYETSSTQPDFDTLIKLANLYNVSTDYILGRTTNTNVSDSDNHNINLIKDILTANSKDLALLESIWNVIKQHKM